MIYKADLHTHSTASDGQYAPAELAELVQKRGAEVWALTDHDNVEGVEEAKAAGKALGLRVIQGVELSADDYLNLHILGYGFATKAIQNWLDSLRGGRDNRKYRIRDFLRTKGLEIPLDEVDAEAAGAPIGRPHFAMVMLNHGMVATRKEAFDRYADWNSSYGSSDSDWADTVEAMRTGALKTDAVVSHVLKKEDLREGLEIMKVKLENYVKIIGWT